MQRRQPAPNLVPVTTLSRKWRAADGRPFFTFHFILSISTNNNIPSITTQHSLTFPLRSVHSAGDEINIAEQVMLLS